MNPSLLLRGPSFRKLARAGADQLQGKEFTPKDTAASRRTFSSEMDPYQLLEFENRTLNHAYGIEIRLADIPAEAGYRAFYLSRPGVPDLQYLGNELIIRFESLWMNNIRRFSQTPSPCLKITGLGQARSSSYQWDFGFHSDGQCERFGLLMTSSHLRATYRWLATD